MKVELVVCTHNPNLDFLQRTVDGLKAQTLSQDQWGFLLVDNGSKVTVDPAYANWHQNGRIVVEPELGLTSARICGIRNTQSELIVFVDDDNVLAPDYVKQVLNIAQQNPKLGAFGAAKILPEFEVEPDNDCRPFIQSLALRDQDYALWSNDPEDRTNPWGAGLIVQRDVAIEFARIATEDPLRKLLGRKGNSLNSAEDIEFAWIACEMGLSKGVFPELQMKHLIDARRVDRNYLLRLIEGHAFSHTLMKYIHHADILKRASRLNRQPNDEIWTSPQSSIVSIAKHCVVWLFAKTPPLKHSFFNCARLATYNGNSKGYQLIDKIEAESTKS